MKIDAIKVNPKKDITIDIVIEWPMMRGLRFLAVRALIKLAASLMPVGCRVIIGNG